MAARPQHDFFDFRDRILLNLLQLQKTSNGAHNVHDDIFASADYARGRVQHHWDQVRGCSGRLPALTAEQAYRQQAGLPFNGPQMGVIALTGHKREDGRWIEMPDVLELFPLDGRYKHSDSTLIGVAMYHAQDHMRSEPNATFNIFVLPEIDAQGAIVQRPDTPTRTSRIIGYDKDTRMIREQEFGKSFILMLSCGLRGLADPSALALPRQAPVIDYLGINRSTSERFKSANGEKLYNGFGL